MRLSPEVTDAYLALQATRRVQEACFSRLESSYIHGSMEEVQLSLSGYLDAAEAMADRLRDLVWAQLIADGIDPITRRPL